MEFAVCLPMLLALVFGTIEATIAVTPSEIDDCPTTATILVSLSFDSVGWVTPMLMCNKTTSRGYTLSRETTGQSSANYQTI